MTYLQSLMHRAQPKADKLTTITTNIAHKVADSKAVKATKVLADKTMVNTVGVGLCLAAPVVQRVKTWADSVVTEAEQLATEKK